MTPWLAGVLLGLASSVHCVAMCGPLVVAIGRTAPASRGARLIHALLYHLARVTTYGLLAIPAGVAGRMLDVRGFGRMVAIGAGVLLLAAAAGSLRRPGRAASAYSRWLTRSAAPLFAWARSHRVAGPLATGAVNGVLPCGLVYAALATAAAAGSATAGVLVMGGFGAATAAVLMALSLGAASMPSSWRARLRPLSPIVLALTAAILIARGVMTNQPHGGHAMAAMHQHHE